MFERDQLIGARYRLRERIAVGGMGEIWRAGDERLLREVAVKVLRPEHADDEAFRTRLQIEAQSAASLNSDNVVGVYDWGEQSDDSGRCVPYIVMELVVGDTVADLLAREGSLSPAQVADIVAAAAAGLVAAHDQSLVHRDIKPANLLRRTDGRVKVADFGIARAKDGSALTTTGTLVGTARYLSPEQVRGQSATPASDIYSLGIVAHQCLTGEVPFVGDGDVATATARLTNPVPPLPASTPAALSDLVMAMLDRDPAQRPTARQLVDTAAQSATTSPIASAGTTEVFPTVAMPLADTASLPVPAQPSPRTRSWAARRYSVAGVALVLLLVGVFLVPALLDGSPSTGNTGTTRTPPPTHATVPAPNASRTSGTSQNQPRQAATVTKPTPPAHGHGPGKAAPPPGHAPGHGHGHGPKPVKPPNPGHPNGH